MANPSKAVNPPARSGIASRTATPNGNSVVLPRNRSVVSDTARSVRPPDSRIRDSRPAVVRPGQNTVANRRPDVDRIRSQPQWRGERDTRTANVSRNFRNGANWSTRCEDWGASPWWNRSCVRPWYGGCWNGNWNSYYYRDYYCYSPWYRSYFPPGYLYYDSYYPLGWGLLGWGLGSMVYDIGYETYYNPYPVSTVVASNGLDVTYTEPLARLAARSTPTDEAGVQEMTRSSESFVADSQVAFKARNYLVALELADKAIAASPGDGALHEYRALVLFALGRYGEATGVLHPVIASGPGWDWATMRALYDSLETYTDQLRRLETYSLDNPTVADGRFLLGYHYMVCGHLDSATVQFESAAKLMPADKISSQLANLARFSVKDSKNSLPPGVERTPAPPAKSPPREIVPLEKLQGTWVAARDSGATVTLRFLPEGKFTWTHLKDAKTTELAGAYSINDNGLLVLDSPDSQIVADVSLPADREMKFVLVGGPPADPGLDFRKP
ncbi:MAG: tetratricopeptide repeat protein [Verrucomicrobiota bacterium]